MKLIKVGAAAVNQTPFDWQNNEKNIVQSIAAARAAGVTILCLPELCITGYGCEDDFFRADLRDQAWQMLENILPHTKEMVVSLGLPVLYRNALFNCAALAVGGSLAGLVAKQNLAGDGMHYEPRWFEPWKPGIVSHLKVGNNEIPLGDIHFALGGIKVGFEICEDAWVGHRPGAELAACGVDVILNPSASHFAFGKMETRKRLVQEGSRAFNATYIYTNLLGNEAGRAIYDGGAIIASCGTILSIGQRFSFQDFQLTTSVVDVEQSRMAQARTYSFCPDLENKPNCVELPFTWPEVRELPREAHWSPSAWEGSPFIKEEEMTRSIALGLFDYLRKTRAKGYVVSLSGGADSTAVSCLVNLMVELSVSELGLSGFKSKLQYINSIQSTTSVREILFSLLICAYQATANSSAATRHSASAVADFLGARFYEFDIEQIVSLYKSMVSSALGRELTWEKDDLALQNVQARVRNPGIWMLANLHDAILLCTSNRSEGAVGYCTMDGDTSGGLSPIAGIDKAFIRRWLRWLTDRGPAGLSPFPVLQTVVELTPGPELRPAARKQSGEDDLMPYEILDAIEEAAIEDNRSVLDCYILLHNRFPSYSSVQLSGWVEKFFQLWSRNQWKRERMAPALHVDTRNLDPRTWRRSPILSGGFKAEIAQMQAFARNDKSSPSAQDPRMYSCLIIVDAQKGFGSKGELPVPDAEAIIPIVNQLQKQFPLVVATQDCHPPDHVSFFSSHKGKKPGDTVISAGAEHELFPVHCVQGSKGAEFLDGLDTSCIASIFRKGTKSDADGLSAFIDNAGNKATEIDNYLKDHGVTTVYVTGLATNYCVAKTALDALTLGYNVIVVEDACRGVDLVPNAVADSLDAMRKAGVKIVSSASLLGQNTLTATQASSGT